MTRRWKIFYQNGKKLTGHEGELPPVANDDLTRFANSENVLLESLEPIPKRRQAP